MDAEAAALKHLLAAGLVLVMRNYRPPGRGRADIDLVMREPGGTLVFVEVRSRSSNRHGSAAASIDAFKRRRLVQAAQHFLLRYRQCPACRFDVVAMDSEQGITWLRGAFDAA
jgi:putative endonuclease